MLARVNRKERVRREMVGFDMINAPVIRSSLSRLLSFYALSYFMLCFVGVRGSLQAAEWVEHRAFGPFVCRADFSLRGREKVFADLADIQRDLYQRLGIPPGSEQIEIYLFRTRSDYNHYIQHWYPDIPSRRALFIKNNGRSKVLVYHSDELDTDLRHECTHALLHASLPMVPLWLDEGLAEYYEVPPSQRIMQNPHRSATVWSYRFWQRQTMNELENKQQLAEMGRNEYRHAWAWVHFMLHGPPEARQELANYLADIREGTPPGSLSARLSAAVPNPDAAIVTHFKTFWR